MAFQKIGIMSIGEMGFHWAKLLKGHGVEVLTYDKDRGEVSRKRGENAGARSVASMAELFNPPELIFSIAALVGDPGGREGGERLHRQAEQSPVSRRHAIAADPRRNRQTLARRE